MEDMGWIRSIQNVIFDMDGTLVDTETLYNRFWVEAGRHFGYPMEPRHALMLRSLSPEYAEPLMKREVSPDFDFFKVREYRRKIMEVYVDEHGLVPKPHMEECLRRLHDAGMKIALATATPEWRARKYLERLGVIQYFDAIATADMVKRGKPAPDIYLLAMEKLRCTPDSAAAIEDSPTGIRSAWQSGASPVMIPDIDQPDGETRRMCKIILPSLHELAELLTGENKTFPKTIS
ncbi:MAG: HAD family phosphatase [Clostridia bacterium]|nr:HAD family phosphatase [Clostridia bacterium]